MRFGRFASATNRASAFSSDLWRRTAWQQPTWAWFATYLRCCGCVREKNFCQCGIGRYDDAKQYGGTYFSAINPIPENSSMTISQEQLTTALSQPEIERFWLGYFQEELRSTIHEQLLEMFEHANARGLSRADLARKIGRRPEQVTRWLSAPANIESDTISDISLGMGYIPRLTFEAVENLFVSRNYNESNAVSDYISGSVDMAPPAALPKIETAGGHVRVGPTCAAQRAA